MCRYFQTTISLFTVRLLLPIRMNVLWFLKSLSLNMTVPRSTESNKSINEAKNVLLEGLTPNPSHGRYHSCQGSPDFFSQSDSNFFSKKIFSFSIKRFQMGRTLSSACIAGPNRIRLPCFPKTDISIFLPLS